MVLIMPGVSKLGGYCPVVRTRAPPGLSRSDHMSRFKLGMGDPFVLAWHNPRSLWSLMVVVSPNDSAQLLSVEISVVVDVRQVPPSSDAQMASDSCTKSR